MIGSDEATALELEAGKAEKIPVVSFISLLLPYAF